MVRLVILNLQYKLIKPNRGLIIYIKSVTLILESYTKVCGIFLAERRELAFQLISSLYQSTSYEFGVRNFTRIQTCSSNIGEQEYWQPRPIMHGEQTVRLRLARPTSTSQR